MDMDLAALLAWIVTALGGLYLLGVWLAHGGFRQQEHGASHLPSPLIFGHGSIAALGLVVWIAFVLTDSEPLAWSAIGILLPVVVMGFGMLVSWIPVRQARTRAPAQHPAANDGDSADEVPAERHFPLPVVLLHGILAVLTLSLVVLAAAGIGVG